MIAKHAALIAAGLTAWMGYATVVPAAQSDQRCGGFVGLRCAPGLWCELPAGTCHGSDLMGTCVKTAAFCAFIYQPVCGCDGKSYGNDCERRSQHVRLRHAGRC